MARFSKRKLLKWHSWSALICVIPLLVICLTGAILVFKHEIDWLFIGEQVRVDESRDHLSERLPYDQLLTSLQEKVKDHEVVGWVVFLEPNRADQVYVMEKGTNAWSYLFIDQYTGNPLSEPRLHDHWFTDWLLELHFNLLLEDVGLIASAIFGLALFFLGISGFILYRQFWKTLFLLRWNARLVTYFSDLHKTVGIICSPVLLVLSFTGVWWNIAGYLHELEEHSDGHEHPLVQERLYNDEISIDSLVAAAQAQVSGFKPTYFSFPYEPNLPITIFGDVPTKNVLTSQYSSTASFDAETGEDLGTYDIRQATVGAKIIDSYRRLHFGDFAGLWSRILWAVAGASPALLSVTGIYVWFKRRRKKRKTAIQRYGIAGDSQTA